MLPVHQITPKEIEEFCKEDTTDKTLVIWIGHSTCLLNFQNTIILMDPVFSKRYLNTKQGFKIKKT